ncbi:MAG: dihydroneopterin aldolase [Pseudomonadota bacterium]
MTDTLPSHDLIRVILKDYLTEARVGLHPWEQHPERPNRLCVNVEMFAPLPPPPTADGAGGIIDYDPIRKLLDTWPSRPLTLLLETLVDEVIALAFSNPKVTACRVSVIKPDIFNHAAGAGIEVFRRRGR